MAVSRMSEVIQRLRKAMLRSDRAGITDGQLLNRYIVGRDEDAFAALVKRHAPMVWGVCRRVLANLQDAEDAFQATFLVLVRKAGTVVPREMVANWLYGVAYMTARRGKVAAAKRHRREKQVVELPETAAPEPDLWADLPQFLDQELSCLPNKYRVVLVLCDLEEKTRRQVARQLGLPEGTIASRLARARTMLAKRLARYGLAVSGGALAAVVSQQAASAWVPPSVVSSTIKAATLVAAGKAAAMGLISIKAAALTEGVLKTMLLSKLKIVTAGLLVVALALAGGAGAICQTQAPTAPKATTKKEREAPAQEQQAERPIITIDGMVDGKKFQPDAKMVEAGAEAAVKLLAASNMVDFWGGPQNRPFDKSDWQRDVPTGIEKKRPYLRIEFGKPRQIEGNLNLNLKAKYRVSEVVFFFFAPGQQDGPLENGPICLWARDGGGNYYFANQIAGHEELVKWLKKMRDQR